MSLLLRKGWDSIGRQSWCPHHDLSMLVVFRCQSVKTPIVAAVGLISHVNPGLGQMQELEFALLIH